MIFPPNLLHHSFDIQSVLPYSLLLNCCSQLSFLTICLNCWFIENKDMVFWVFFFLVSHRTLQPGDTKHLIIRNLFPGCSLTSLVVYIVHLIFSLVHQRVLHLYLQLKCKESLEGGNTYKQHRSIFFKPPQTSGYIF